MSEQLSCCWPPERSCLPSLSSQVILRVPQFNFVHGSALTSATSQSAEARVRAGRPPPFIVVPALLGLIVVILLIAVITRDAAWTAGTAAVATMVVLAYQGWQVQESTAIGAQAIVVGQAAGIEAEKLRLDNRASRIHISLGSPAWPPGSSRPVTVALGAGSPPARLEEGHVFRLPRSANDPC